MEFRKKISNNCLTDSIGPGITGRPIDMLTLLNSPFVLLLSLNKGSMKPREIYQGFNDSLDANMPVMLVGAQITHKYNVFLKKIL
jgi:hypothetical protein